MDPKHDQTTNEAPAMRSKPKANGAQPEPQAEMKIRKPEEDVLDVIESVESQLGALRKAHEEHRSAMQALGQQRIDLQQQGEDLEQRERELTDREVELAEMRQQFEQREMDLVQRASGLETRESKLASQAETLEQQEAELESRAGEIKRKISELDEQLAGISKRKHELDALETEVQEKLAREETAAKKLEQTIADLEHTRQQLGEQDARFSTLSAEMNELRAQHEQTSIELKSAVSKLRGREIELGERSKALEELAEKAGDIQHELGDTRAQYEKRIAATEQEIGKLREQLTREQQVSTGLRAQLETLEHQQGAEADARVTQLQSELGERQAQLEEAIARIDALQNDGQSRSEEDQLRIDSLTAKLEGTRAKLEEVNAQLAGIGAEADEELTSERERAAALEAQVGTLGEELSEVRASHDELKARLEQQPEGDPEAVTKLQSELEEIGAHRGELEAKLGERESQLRELAERVVKLEAELSEAGERSSAEQDEQARAQIESLETQCSELISTVERLNTELEAAQAKSASQPVPERSDEWTTKRRERLAKMRAVLKGDAEKVRRATEALRTRYEQCEQVLTKRAELAEAYEAITGAQRKYQNKEVRSGVILGLFGMLAITLILGVGSWFISGRIAPGLYSSRATLTATSSDTKLSDGDLGQWEAYITGLTSDPRFLEVAAERMKRRGITEFSTPGELGQHMQESLDVAASMPGEVVFEYRDHGAERAQRVLDTFSVALASAANNARARRVDAAVTTVEQSATISQQPLDTTRLKMAGMIFGGAILATLIVGGILWRRLAAAKARFENDSRVEVLFDDEEWKLPT